MYFFSRRPLYPPPSVGLTSERHPDRDPESLRARGPFASFSAAINEDYAKANGYDYLFVTLNSTTLHQQLQSKYNCTPEHIQAKSFHDLKYGPSSFHPTYQYMRASSWNKIPPLYHLAYEYGHMYDWVLYMDSDVTLNPAFLNRSMSDVLDQWQNGKTTLFGDNLLPNKNNFVQWGQTDLSKSNMLFLTNFPWRDDMPCAGIFMFRPNRVGLTQLQEWWNYNLPAKNLYDFMEQDALWYMKEADSDDIIHKDGANNGGDSSNGFDGDKVTVNRRGIINNGHLRTHMKTLMNPAQIAAMFKVNHFAINATSMSLIFEPQFHGEYHGAADIQFLHMANYVAQKMSYLSVALFQTKKKLDGEKKYVKHMQSVLDYHHLHLDILGLTEKMELTNNDVEAGTNAFNRKYGIEHDHANKKYEEFPPTYEARMDSDWHAKDFTGLAKLDKRKKESYFILEHSGKVLNKYLIQVHGDHAIYLVMNNTRHAFPDWNTFLQMGFDTDRVLKFHDPGKLRAAERYIPTGVPLLPFGKQKNGQIFDFEAAKDKWGDQALV